MIQQWLGHVPKAVRLPGGSARLFRWSYSPDVMGATNGPGTRPTPTG